MAINGTNKEAAAVVPLATTATLIHAGRPTGGGLIIQNTSASDVYVWDSSVTVGTGYKLLAATSTHIDSLTDTLTQDAWYGIVASGTADVRVFASK